MQSLLLLFGKLTIEFLVFTEKLMQRGTGKHQLSAISYLAEILDSLSGNSSNA